MANKSSEVKNKRFLLVMVKALHLFAAIQFSFAVYYDFSQVHVPSTVLRSNRNGFGGKFKYLTFIDGVMIRRI